MSTEESIEPNHPFWEKMSRGLAVAGPLAAVAIVGWRVMGTSENVHFYFADVRVALLVFFWLAFGLVQSLWLGSGAHARAARWVVDDPSGRARALVCARQFTIGTLLTCVAIAVLVKVFHVPLDPLGVVIFSVGLVGYRVVFDLLGYLLASSPIGVRRGVRVVLLLGMVAAGMAWFWTAYTRGVLGHFMATLVIAGSATATQWFYPADNTLDLLHALTNDGPILACLLPVTALACAFALAYALRSGGERAP